MRVFDARNPRAEAEAAVGRADLAVHVLEPSPPAVATEPFFADDPAAVADGETAALTPTSAGAVTWAELAADDGTLAEFARRRWLGPWPTLPALPGRWAERLPKAHRLAYSVVCESRRVANGKFGLRFTLDGFGTPFFGADEQVRVADGHLIRQRGATVDAEPVTTLAAAARFVGVEPATVAAEDDSPALGDLDERLEVDTELTAFLGAWYGMGAAALEELRVRPEAVDASRVQLWPGHFDIAAEAGDADAGSRATLGASPGDHAHPEPYLYVGPWNGTPDDDPFWNAAGFPGAELPFRELAATDDPHGRALAFWLDGLRRLA